MSNYVANRIICSKDFLEKYLIDYDPFGDGVKIKEPYITFNKLYGVKSLSEYMEKYGEYIYYGFGFNIKEIENNKVEIKFNTKWFYPICAIVKAIETENDIIWYLVEENIEYISRFRWNNGKVIEEVLDINNEEFNQWYDKYIATDTIETDEYDDSVWYYDYEDKKDWKEWPTNDLIKRYKEHMPFEEYHEWKKQT